jgi:DNA sulfur modification protein DndE
MPELTLQRIPFTVEADSRLRLLKSRTGITPNILCRIGFCLSLEEPGIPFILPNDFKQGREINRYTLLGKDDQIYVALLAVRLDGDGIPLTDINDMFLAHINRGVEVLTARVKTVCDLGFLN